MTASYCSDFDKMWNRKKDWRRLQALVLDEVSMLSAPLLDAFDDTVREIRGSSASFGGIQLVFVGDFAQLPPVFKSDSSSSSSTNQVRGQGQPDPASFVEEGLAFEGTMWQSAHFEMVVLDTTYRQSEPYVALMTQPLCFFVNSRTLVGGHDSVTQ